MNVNDNISTLKGIGKKYTELLEKLNIDTILDLLLYFPCDYEMFFPGKLISDAQEGEKICIQCSVLKISKDIYVRKNMVISSIILNDGDSDFTAKWFNQPFIKKTFRIGEEYKFVGKVQIQKNGKKVLMSPKVVKEQINNGSIIPKYSLTKGLSNSFFIKYISNILNNIKIAENLPKEIVDKYRLCTLDFAIKNIHNPNDSNSLNKALDRLKFQELFTYSVKLLLIKDKRKTSSKGIPLKIAKELTLLKEKLPFELTDAQKKAVRQILIDEKKPLCMNRLLQGDVGSGKTIVALIAIFNVIYNGYQAALMAPTEILAKQHFLEFDKLLKDFKINIEFLVGSTPLKEKQRIKDNLKSGKIDLVIGTHSLIEDDVEFEKLGMIVTDEQHRFGVNQRAKLYNKSINSDVLVMSATPIPRTLSLCLYGDLDISIIDQLPPGRKKIDTYWFGKNQRKRVYNYLRKELENKKQAYVVCPLVEENDSMQLNSVQKLTEDLQNDYLKGFKVKSLYGKMKQKDKDEIMNEFKNNRIDVLVATTVIEVGVNVPNATIMIIEDAERFGLSQLHQLRGRVGRGVDKSSCYLIAESKSDVTKKRMETMVESNDGFYISEQDLKIRGSGEVFGFRQHGDESFTLSNPIEDINILKCANYEARNIFNNKDKKYDYILESIVKRIDEDKKLICFN
ncbi:ATP-dependent DNA helicase RecG [Clostridium sediminicola]|uniref:ATP-dependent DNA helicase RecG n=1 Tax=Clostridium sediminicola TaxID=3114879 RepID=UPI0031F2792B